MTQFAFNQLYHDTKVNDAWHEAHENNEPCPICHQAVYQGNWRKHMALKHSDVTDPLSYDEARSLSTHEAVITAGLDMFYAVGKALATIHEQRLYRATHSSFKAYCADRWNMSRQRGYQLMKAAGVVDNLECLPMVDTNSLSINERQARALAPLPPQQQRVVYELAVQTAPDGKPTAESLRDLADVAIEVSRTHAIDDGTGEQIEVADIFRQRVLEQSYEREQRHTTYILEGGKKKAERIAAKVEALSTTPTYLFETERTANGLFYVTVRYGVFANAAEANAALIQLQKRIEKDCTK